VKNMCPVQKKQGYTQSAAIRAAISYSGRRGTPLRPYYHKACGKWHLTKTPRVDTNDRVGA
jgi:hypothetical protein